jgi:hypothetical protein
MVLLDRILTNLVMALQGKVQPVPNHIIAPNWRGQYTWRSELVFRKEAGICVQGEDQEEWITLPVHMGQGGSTSW